MSLIVARKENSKIYIVSDTKLTAPEGQEFSKGQHIEQGANVIKSTIVDASRCISFAGNSVFADLALKKIADSFSNEEMNAILLSSHLESEQSTDYIFCAVTTGKANIYEIRNSEVKEVEASWIGSQRAFQQFQSYMVGSGKSHRKNFITVTRAESGDLFHRMTSAIDEVIQDETIPEVAGFKISVYFDGDRFVYEGYLDTYFTAEQMTINIPSGVSFFGMPITHANAAKGGYTVNFFNSQDNYNYVGLHVKQGDFGILYTRWAGGLLQPTILENMDELDFLDHVQDRYHIGPSGLTQDAFTKFGLLGKELFDQGDFSGASAVYTRGINHLHGHEKSRFYFNRAICSIQMKKIPEAVESFGEAIKINPTLQAEATRIMHDVFNNRR